MDSKSTSNTSSPSATAPGAQIKKENEEEIKDFAETAMNELLGWYGYERLELRRWAASRAKDGCSPDPNSELKNKDECSWCNKNLASEGGAIQQAGATFCSELCFSQSRRANFKRAKTCDWCRHVRHTVAYVDFQDGATQLQFCSDKCLNQYKMHIFCRETQAQLELHPHLRGSAAAAPDLITPDLWLGGCRSRGASPAAPATPGSEPDGDPTPDTTKPDKLETLPSKPSIKKSSLPLITVAPTSKLMKSKSSEEKNVQKSPEAKKDIRHSKMNLRRRRASKCSATVTSQTIKHSTPKAQDLRMCSPSLEGSSPVSTGNSVVHSPPHSLNHSHSMPQMHYGNPVFGVPPPVFIDQSLGPDLRHPGVFPPRLNFMPRPGIPMAHERPTMPPPMNFPPQIGQIPPVTVLVPYPVILPVPLPIPIPMPLTSFIQAHFGSKVKNEARTEDTEGPLDFTINGTNRRDDALENHGGKDTATNERTYEEPNNFERSNENDKNGSESNETLEHRLPKFKITRLGNKMAKIVTKTREQAENTRPLRKRRRIVEVAQEEEPLIPKTRKIVQV